MARRWLGPFVGTALVVMCAIVVASAAGYARAQQQTPPPTQTPPPGTQPIPKPFPGSNPPGTPPGKPGDGSAPAPAPAVPPKPNVPSPQELANAPLYPAADFLDSFDAGRGQKYFIYGTNAPYVDIIAFYRKQLGTGGQEVFRAPAMQRFDLGRFDEQTMAYPPSVVVKDYSWNNSPGYLFVSGTTEKRYKTIIQIVPATAR
jgi:hypothetical protein